ncbi:MAG: hypothetical protein FWD47_03780 [Treponema sp.]|nr:hypothetical protein [Treponema sp.]
MKKLFLLLVFIPFLVFGESLYSPTWGFYIDLPEGYEFHDGDARDRFSFAGPQGLMFDIIIYADRYNSMLELVNDVNRRLSNNGDVDFFEYNGKQAVIFKLDFGGNDGWGLALELGGSSARKPILLALAYAPNERTDLELFHLSALDSISPTEAELRYPGPIMEYGYPRGTAKSTPLAIRGLNALIYENDAEASQVLIEREYILLQYYLNTPLIQDAWVRYYRFIYRDSYDRIKDAASVITRHFGGYTANTDAQKREFAQKVLTFIQNLQYERFIYESDFLNLVSSVTEGKGDCDSHSMLFALILAQVNIRGAMMLSPHYSHAMALADITGSGARVDAYGTNWLVAETTAKIDIGLIDQEQADITKWFVIIFD